MRTTLLTILGVTAVALAIDPGTAHARQAARPTAAALARAVDSLAQEGIRADLVPGFGLGLVMDGRVILTKGYGFSDATAGIRADEQTLWYLSSTSKSFIGFAVTLLASGGRIDLNAPMTVTLPGVRWHPDADPSLLTLAHFLSHTHHLLETPVVSSAAFTGAIAERDWPGLLVHTRPTGSQDLNYGNLGYNVAAMVVDRLHPAGWRDFQNRELFAPVGMRDTYNRVSGLDPRRFARPHTLDAAGRWHTAPFQKTDETMNSAGGHLSTIGDLARWVIVQMDGGVIDGRRIWPEEVVRRGQQILGRQTRAEARDFLGFHREGWAAGWDVGHYRDEPMVSRFGGYSTTNSQIGFLPARRIGVVAEVIGGVGIRFTTMLMQYAFDLEAGRPDALERAGGVFATLVAQRAAGPRAVAAQDSIRAARQQVPLGRPREAFAGRYTNEALGTIEFTVAGSGWRYRWGVVEGPVEVLDATQARLRFEVGGSARTAAFRFGQGAAAEGVQIDGWGFERVP